MLRRNGGMTKVVVAVVAFFGLVYFIYLYNDLSGQLKNTQHSAERYRREQESVSAQLQDQILAKDELKQKSDNEKEQMTNRLNSLQQQYKMLKSQHEDMESEFGRLQNEKATAEEEHKKQDEERAVEYNQFKQEKILEITSLKDSVANLEREKEQLSQQVAELKAQLQNSVDLVQQANARQQQIEQQYQLLQQQQQQQHQAQQQQLQAQQVVGKPGGSFMGIGRVPEGNLPGGQFQPVGNWRQGGNQQDLGLKQNVHQSVQGVLQGLKKQFPDTENTLGKLVHGMGNLHENLMLQQQGENNAQNDLKSGNQDNFNLAEDILKSVQDKHKPVDADLLEEHQKLHQLLPPGNPDQDEDLGHQKLAQNMPFRQDSRGAQRHQQVAQEAHQVAKPNFEDKDDYNAGHHGNLDDPDTGAADGNHDNRIENQGPVNLQVQEPNLRPEAGKNKIGGEDELHFRPHIPAPIDSQIQPNQPVDDSKREEQLGLPIKKQDEEDHIARKNEDDDDEEYDDDYDKENDNKADDY